MGSVYEHVPFQLPFEICIKILKYPSFSYEKPSRKKATSRQSHRCNKEPFQNQSVKENKRGSFNRFLENYFKIL